MKYLWILPVALLLLFGLYLLMIRPKNSRRHRMQPFLRHYIAHRGLHGASIPENSMAAFAAAVDAGYAIELDVQMTADGKLVIFHDKTLHRMCGVRGALYKTKSAALARLSLAGTAEGIPLLSDVLRLVRGRVPLVIEVKTWGKYGEIGARLQRSLKGYPGAYCIQSFDPRILSWFRRHSPQTLRGQLSTDFYKSKMEAPTGTRFLLTNLMCNFLSRPDFISYDYHYENQPSFRLCRRLFRPCCAAWTVRSAAQLQEARENFDLFIFEGFRPAPMRGRNDENA